MRCHGCREIVPTRFIVLGSAAGAIVVSTMRETPVHLCDDCFEAVWEQVDEDNSTRGFAARHAAYWAAWFMVRNRLERRRALREPLDEAEPGPDTADDVALRHARIVLRTRALNLAGTGWTFVIVAVVMGTLVALGGDIHSPMAPAVACVFGGIALAGIVAILVSVRKRSRILAMTEDEIVRELDRMHDGGHGSDAILPSGPRRLTKTRKRPR